MKLKRDKFARITYLVGIWGTVTFTFCSIKSSTFPAHGWRIYIQIGPASSSRNAVQKKWIGLTIILLVIYQFRSFHLFFLKKNLMQVIQHWLDIWDFILYAHTRVLVCQYKHSVWCIKETFWWMKLELQFFILVD
jgi:hypothetical protein